MSARRPSGPTRSTSPPHTHGGAGRAPATITKLKDIVQGLESCADAFEELANVIESLALKES